MSGGKPQPFLRLVAKAFAQDRPRDLHRVCFVFPNRRSGLFFNKELAKAAAQTTLSPKITTISDFLLDITGAVEVQRIEALFILYSIYKDIFGDQADDFDRFAFWGDVILNDFNDVDKYLANPADVFTNIRDLKSIRSNFLTKEQIEVISRYFGDKWISQSGEEAQFWRNPEVYGKSRAAGKFFSIWEALLEMYNRFNAELSRQGLSYSGRIYRDAAKRVKQMDKSEFPEDLYVFVGFNALSLSEIKIFQYLGDKGIADYYWDANSPALADGDNKASLFMSRNKAMFKPRLYLDERPITKICKIRAFGIPSNIGQAKYASITLDKLIAEGAITDTGNAINTAVVLPDEALLSPLLDSLTPSIQELNVTMGFPLRNSPIAGLLVILARMHRRARKSRGACSYFIEDVNDALSHPLVKNIAPDQADSVTDQATRKKLFYIPFDDIKATAPSLSDIFAPISDTKSTEELIHYVKNLAQFIESAFLANSHADTPTVDMGFISMCVDLLGQVADTISKYPFEMTPGTFFYLIGRHLASASVAFEGEPMKGLQIMGILETRCLDFENVIILSMNERSFPRKHYSRSFIPNNLRRAFGMATTEHQDAMYAYYFYRMISRANQAILIYDARGKSLGAGEPSRYIQQIKVLYPGADISQQVVNFSVKAPDRLIVEVEKNDRVMELLNRYRDPQSGKFLSASSINSYIDCPLKFYFEKVEDLKIDDEVTEFMTDATLGTVVHQTLNELYNSIAEGPSRHVSKEKITALLKNEKLMLDTITKMINQQTAHLDNCTEALNGETQLVRVALLHYVKNVLNYDYNLGGFYLVESEKNETLHWTVAPGLSINIRQFIDRVDKIDIDGQNAKQRLRIVDYKTGDDTTGANSIDTITDGSKKDRHKAMLQLMIYCNVYAAINNLGSQPIQPVIYKTRDVRNTGFKFNKKTVEDYNQLNPEFLEELTKILQRMFDPSAKFTQTTLQEKCGFCKFTAFCHRD